MKALWITNILFPDISEHLGVQAPVTGGWMVSLAQAINKNAPHVELAVATLYGEGKNLLEKKIKGVTYYCLPFNSLALEYNPEIEKAWREVKNRYQPNITHLHGTEFPFGLAYLRGCGVENCVVSIQGLRRGISRYALADIPISKLVRMATIYDLLKTSSWNAPKEMLKGGKIEVEYLTLVKHVIGRTRWDHDHIWAVNPNIQYHFCNETLRESFYNCEKWNLKVCKKHSIFLSQAALPLKGINKVIEAMPLILRHYPDTEIYVAGGNFLSTKTWRDRLKQNAFARYIKKLIVKNCISNKIHFLGPLNEAQMIAQLQSANVFICPSSIENSPNSLGEAQLIGVPCVGSYVGGIPDMMNHNVDGLIYRFGEIEMLAACVCRIFGDESLAIRLSHAEIKLATKRHSWEYNAKKLVEIYNDITNKR